MTYTVRILRRAQEELAGLPLESYQEVRDGIRSLARDPIPPASGKLAERDGWRLPVGKFRVVYELDSQQGAVTVLHVGLRADA
ncbi:MAG TPA: type II toxin-antitoxin system RelE/ParE family toxin [Terriglobia bacterium]|nr:type II toxin-antitoxin system RelE/ParE family toxin [Terriglobia bacterium]